MTLISTTENNQWVIDSISPAQKLSSDNVIHIHPKQAEQVMEGFGSCFNELGWKSLLALPVDTRESIFKDLFKPGNSANFSICRMPIGANDFAIDYYSFDETENDFELEHFSIDHDKTGLIPYIKSALKQNPNLKIWASPWVPPKWMKKNKCYSCNFTWPGIKEKHSSDVKIQEDVIPEGDDAFICDEKHFLAYAQYFGKFIDSYKREGINIFAVMPQNEFNSSQPYPSCVWKIESLIQFIGKYLGPEMEKRGVETYFGTMERPFPSFIDLAMSDKDSSQYIKCIGFQWDGKKAIKSIHKKYPAMRLWQTESECGDGKNTFGYAMYTWTLIHHYINNGASAYLYWNTVLSKGGVSRWGWAQNSLVVVDEENQTYHFTYEYYLMKHLSHFVQPNARKISTTRMIKDDDLGVKLLAFINPNSELVIIVGNEDQFAQNIDIVIEQTIYNVTLHPLSFNTIVIPS